MQPLLTPISLALRLVVPGAAWAWCFPLSDIACSRPGRLLLNAARILVLGTAVNAGMVVILAQTGRFTTGTDTVAWVAVSLAGMVLGRRRRRPLSIRYLRDGAWIAPAAAAWFAAAMALPERGEWLAGGWDPGVYQQQGVQVAREGTFRPGPLPVYADMTGEAFAFFTRGTSSYREAFPGVPLDPETRGYRPYFFRLTPAFTALLHRVGGIDAVVRVNLLLAPVAVLGLAAVLFALTSSWSLAGFAALLLAAGPVFVYHTHVPVTEMLHLVLMCGIGLSLYGRSRRWEGLLVLSLFLALAVLNRLAFLPFAGLLLAAMAWLDLRRPARARCAVEHGVAVLAVSVAGLFNFRACAITMVRLRDVTPLLVGCFLTAVAAVVLVDLLGMRERPRRKTATVLAAVLGWGFLALVLCGGILALVAFAFDAAQRLGMIESGGRVDRLGHVVRLAAGLQAYLGPLTVAGAVAGGVLVFRRMRTLPRELFVWCLFGAAATAALVVRPSIWEVLPWALRRFVPYTLPLLAVLNALWLSALWRGEPPRLKGVPGRVLACGGLAILLAATAGRTARAWTATEYNGIGAALAEVAARVEPGDILVVDSRRWCAPLALLHERQVLNGERLWDRRDEADMREGLRLLSGLGRDGRRVRFLTSTEDGLKVYPAPPEPTNMDWESEPYRFEVVIHSARARDFAREAVETRFRLFTWLPE